MPENRTLAWFVQLQEIGHIPLLMAKLKGPKKSILATISLDKTWLDLIN